MTIGIGRHICGFCDKTTPTLMPEASVFFAQRSRMLSPISARAWEMWYNIGASKMCMLDEIRAKRDEIYAIARKHKAEKLWVFGSCARKEERPDSDVDMLVKYNGSIGLFELFDFESEIADKVSRKVDLVSATALERSPCFAYNVRKEMVEL